MRDGGAVFLVIVTRLVAEDAVSYVRAWAVCRPYNDPYPYPVAHHVRYVSRPGLSRPAVMIVILFLTQFTRLARSRVQV